jgi:hypothetical protein
MLRSWGKPEAASNAPKMGGLGLLIYEFTA